MRAARARRLVVRRAAARSGISFVAIFAYFD